MNQEVIKFLFEYNPETGIFVWKHNKKIAGNKTSNGYWKITFLKKQYKAHRLVWIYMYGNIPEGYEIDHINRIRNDNRLSNLRLATRKQNCNNRNKRIDNTSGYPGVYWDKDKKKWRAQCQIDGKVVRLGRFNNAHEAHEAYEKYLYQNTTLTT